MRHLYYIIRYLRYEKENTLIKVVSLSLGLLVGIVLFARIAFEKSFDTFYPERENLYVLMSSGRVGDTVWEPSMGGVHAPMPSAFLEDIPEIQYAAITSWPFGKAFRYEGKDFRPVTLFSDSLFFKTMGIRLLQGDGGLLGLPDNIFVSATLAQTLFGNEEPAGKILMADDNKIYTVQGVFDDIPENCHQRFDVVGSFASQYGYAPEYGWDNQDSFNGYVRLHPGADVGVVNDKIRDVIRKNRDEDLHEAQDHIFNYSISPVEMIHSGSDYVKRMCLILSLLAVSVLLVSAMNYILVSISSLATRAKSVGIFKCNGASQGNVFSLFLYETGMLTFVSVLFVILLLLVGRGFIEDITNTSFSGLFNPVNLWIPFILIGVIFLLAGYAPARIVSSVPVTQVFRAVSVNKKYWKRFLLFIQFSGTTFVMLLMFIILFQYEMVTHKDLGYDPEGIVYSAFHVDGETPSELSAKLNACKQEFLQLPYVTHAAITEMDLTSNYGAMPSFDENYNVLFTARWNCVEADYLPAIGVEFIAGSNFTADGQFIVNETFVRKMGWTDNPIGKKIITAHTDNGTVVGVVRDFAIMSFRAEVWPVMLESYSNITGVLTLRVAGLTSARLDELNRTIAALFPDQIREFLVQNDVLLYQYNETRQFRDSVIVSFLIALFISGMGLYGYVGDEIHRRTKEIAIRKVNGATSGSILSLLYRDISWLSVPAIFTGLLIAFYFGRKWLEDFAVKISLSPVLFLIGGGLVVLLIFVIVTIKSWEVANQNPVNCIKSE